MTDAWSQVREASLDRRTIAELAKAIPAEAVPELVFRADREREAAAFRVATFLSLHHGEANPAAPRLPASILRSGTALIADAELLAAVAPHLEGDVAGVLIEAVRALRIDPALEPAALLVAELWGRRAGKPRPPMLLAMARIRARRELTQEGEDAMVALHGLLDDAALGRLLAGLHTADIRESARALASRLADRVVKPALDALPERPRKEKKGAGTVRRAGAKVGRNDACWCGSGKKYKACHEAADRDRDDVAAPGGLPDPEALPRLSGPELARLDPALFPPERRVRLLEELGRTGELAAAERAVAAWVPAAGEGTPTEHDEDAVTWLLEELARSRDREALTAARARFAHVPLRPDVLPEVGLCGPDPLGAAEAWAHGHLDDGACDLMNALATTGYPGLAVLLGRGALVLGGDAVEHARAMEILLEARDELLADPEEPLAEVLERLAGGVDPEVERQLEGLTKLATERAAALAAAQEALGRLRAELAAREEAAKAARPAEVREVVKIVEDPQGRELRERVEALKAELKDRHQERNALRKELDEALARLAEREAPAEEEDAAGSEDEDDGGPGLDVSVASRLRLPVWPEGFHERLSEVPEATARAALMRVGELCAGFDVAYREVRPLRGFADTWRVKVGRSYRLLFRPNGDRLEVLDLLHRQDLEKRLFRLRRGGEFSAG